MTSTTGVLFSASPDYLRAAQVELKRALPVVGFSPVGPDAGIVEVRATLPEVAAVCRSARVRFVRHLAEVLGSAPRRSLKGKTPEDIGQLAVEVLRGSRMPEGDSVSVHAWDSGESGISPTPVRRAVVADLESRGIRVAPSGCDETVSLCLGTQEVVVAGNATRYGLVDWPGGRLRLAATKDQVSRAEFKLEELFHHINLDLRGVALDLGAAPGGWARILLQHGVSEVHTVDPAALDPRVAKDRRVKHHSTTAGEYLRNTNQSFDLVVNDMRMDQLRAVRLVLHAAQHLRLGGLAITTLKLRGGDPVADVDRALELINQQFDVLLARQLQHNRHEITVVGRLRAASGTRQPRIGGGR